MAEYVKKEDVLALADWYEEYDSDTGEETAFKYIDPLAVSNIPAADVAPVVHGRWVVENEASIRCSECCFNRASIKMPLDYCPNCGARMDGEGK